MPVDGHAASFMRKSYLSQILCWIAASSVIVEQLVDQSGNVSNVDTLVTIHVSASFAYATTTQQVVDQSGHVANVDCMIMVHVTNLVIVSGNYFLEDNLHAGQVNGNVVLAGTNLE